MGDEEDDDSVQITWAVITTGRTFLSIGLLRRVDSSSSTFSFSHPISISHRFGLWSGAVERWMKLLANRNGWSLVEIKGLTFENSSHHSLMIISAVITSTIP